MKSMERKWKIAQPITERERNAFPEIPPIILQLLWNRGLHTQESIDEFLNLDFSQDVHHPDKFRDMAKAVDYIGQALKKNEKIVVHGDYDADGVCGSAVLVSALKIVKPDCQVEVYLPHREIEGYGMNLKTVTELARKGVKLIITVDCGTTNIEEINLAREKGIKVVVSDHHLAHPQLPPAQAIINPALEGETYPFKNLSGTGVAFKLAQALFRRYQVPEAQEKWLLDLVAIGSIGDYVALLGENRTLVRYGLVVLKKTRRLGLRALMDVSALRPESVDARSVAFQIVPRLNAAGRVDHANSAYALLMAGLPDEAAELAANLNQLNQSRQRLTDQMTTEARAQIGKVEKNKFLLVAQNPEWPAGLVGLVASRLVDEYHRPTIIIGRRQNLIIGSGRSIPEFDITKALKEHESLLQHYGGHRQACGFTLKDSVTPEDFIRSLSRSAKAALAGLELQPGLEAEAKLSFSQIDWPLVEALEAFAPFGEGNPAPVFVSSGLSVADWERVGADRKHLRLVARDSASITRRFIGFGLGDWGDKLTADDPIDLAYEIGTNQWNGTQELQLKIVDLKFSS